MINRPTVLFQPLKNRYDFITHLPWILHLFTELVALFDCGKYREVWGQVQRHLIKFLKEKSHWSFGASSLELARSRMHNLTTGRSSSEVSVLTVTERTMPSMPAQTKHFLRVVFASINNTISLTLTLSGESGHLRRELTSESCGMNGAVLGRFRPRRRWFGVRTSGSFASTPTKVRGRPFKRFSTWMNASFNVSFVKTDQTKREQENVEVHTVISVRDASPVLEVGVRGKQWVGL